MGKAVEKGSLGELRDLVSEMKTVMLVSLTPTGELHARPMAVQDPKEMSECDLWFVSKQATTKVGEIAGDDHVAVCGYRKDGAYLTISARARVVRDAAAVKAHWKPDWKLWFPDGPEDPEIVFLKLDVTRAEYWEPEGGKLRILVDMVKAFATGKPAADALPPAKTV